MEILEVGGRDVEQDFGFRSHDFDAEVVGSKAERQSAVVGDADVSAGVDAFARDGDHDGEAWCGDDLVGAAEEGLVDATRAGFADDNVVREDGFRDAGGERKCPGTQDPYETDVTEETHRIPLDWTLAFTREVLYDPKVAEMMRDRRKKGCTRAARHMQPFTG